MKTGRHARVAIILVLALIVTSISIMPQAAVYSYGTDGTNDGLTEAEERALEEGIYRDTTMKIWYANTDAVSNDTVSVRYYTDMPNVPYIKLYDFFMLNDGVHDGDFVVEKTDDHKYEVRNYSLWPNRDDYASAEIDTLADTLYSDCIRYFTFVSNSVGGENLRFPTECDISAVVREYDPVTIDFDDRYHIDLRTGGTDGKDLYFPLATANDLFATPHGNIMVWDGEIIYVKNPNVYEDYFYFEERQDDNGGIYYVENDTYAAFTNRIFNGNSDAEREEDLAKFAFNELNFQLDYAYGFPGRELAHPMYEKHQTLEEFLEDYTAEDETVLGTDIIELLKSENWGEYLLGYNCLDALLYDGGHTHAQLWDEGFSGNHSKIREQLVAACRKYPALASWSNKYNNRGYEEYLDSIARDIQRREAYGISADETYIRSGDTAIYILDLFLSTLDAQKALSDFYKGSAFPTEDCKNTIVKFVYALRHAKEDGVKNFVIDVTNNGGGYILEMLAIFGIIDEKGPYYFGSSDRLTGELRYEIYKVDRNLDRYFDERDAEVIHNLNIVLLESRYTFSAGNMLAMRMKESGHLVLGEKSGGGTGKVQYLTAADGLMWRISSSYYVDIMLVDKDYDADLGAVPTIELLKKDANGDYPRTTVGPDNRDVVDYSDFYNVENMKRMINDFFAAKNANSGGGGGGGGGASADTTAPVEVKAEDGSASKTTTDANGIAKTEATVSREAMAQAAKENKPVTLPMNEAKPSADAAKAPVVKVDLPEGTAKAKVEIPVKDVSPSIVAVLVKADGTEEIITKTMMSENGIVAELKDGEAIKIVDNHKDFGDVESHWAKDDIDFITARGVFNGTGNGTFDPTGDMTRGMLMTVLARYDGVDASGADWQEKGAAWAKENNISDGTGLTEKVTREQLVTMLWRYAGSPEVSGESATAAYTDADSIHNFAAVAMDWAVSVGLIQGSGDELNPDGNAQRSQLAAIMHRFMVMMASK